MAGVLEGKSAVVTGAGGGIGRAIAIELAAQGASVVVNDIGVSLDGAGRSAGPADEVVAQIRSAGGKAVVSYESVADFDGAERTISTCVRSFGKLDIVVNAAGIDRPAMIFNMTEQAWRSVLEVHLFGTFNLSRHACVLMRQQKSGRIINITSDGWRGTVGHVNYGAAKGGIVSLTISIAREMGKYGVTANAIAPVAGTRMTLGAETIEGFRKRLASGLMTQEQFDAALDMPGPEHVSPFVAYLASDQAGMINGQIFHAEGGRIGIYSQPVEVKNVYRDYKKYGSWTVEELAHIVPKSLLADYVNPAPPASSEANK